MSRQRGSRSDNHLAEQAIDRIEHRLRETDPNFGPTLAEREGIVVSRETVRHIQVRLGMHKTKRRRQPKRTLPLGFIH